MDIEGLGRLIEEKHAQTVLMFNDVKEELIEQRTFCANAMQGIDKKVSEHETTLTKIKTYGSLLSFAWGVIVLFSKEITDFLWRR